MHFMLTAKGSGAWSRLELALRHPHILSLHAVFKNEANWVLVMDRLGLSLSFGSHLGSQRVFPSLCWRRLFHAHRQDWSAERGEIDFP